MGGASRYRLLSDVFDSARQFWWNGGGQPPPGGTVVDGLSFQDDELDEDHAELF